jgi:hypothetical protein
VNHITVTRETVIDVATKALDFHNKRVARDTEKAMKRYEKESSFWEKLPFLARLFSSKPLHPAEPNGWCNSEIWRIKNTSTKWSKIAEELIVACAPEGTGPVTVECQAWSVLVDWATVEKSKVKP